MLVETLADLHVARDYFLKRHSLAEKVVGRRYIVLDTETESKTKCADDALVYGRSKITVVSACMLGHAFSFPTRSFGPKFPSLDDISKVFLAPFLEDGRCTIVFHNWKYDAQAIYTETGLALTSRVYCTLTGAWCAAEYFSKGLKSRSYRLGRVLSETKSIDFSNLASLAEYAETDVIATDELFQAQQTGKVFRPGYILGARSNKPLSFAELRTSSILNWMPRNLEVPKSEILDKRKKIWMDLVELPVIQSTIRAERRGMPFQIPILRGIRQQLLADLDSCLKTVFGIARRKVDLNSNADLAKVFTELGIPNPFRTRKTGAMAFDAKSLGKLKDAHPLVKAIIAYKDLNKMLSVYVGSTEYDPTEEKDDSGLEHYVNKDTGRIHCSLATTGAVTGRSSCSNPNLQQIPSKKDKYGLRRAFGFEK